jgi:phosphoserine aminotransferase
MGIPANYKVLFMQGGAIGENAIVPMNLIGRTASADYVITGDWSKKSAKEAKTTARSTAAASGEAGKFTAIPPQAEWKLDPGASYVHICSNETIGGVEFHWTPDTGSVPLVADMSSNILSRPIDVSQVRPDLRRRAEEHGPLGPDHRDRARRPAGPRAARSRPSAFNYQLQAEADSMYNTPPTYAIYIAGLVLQHVKAMGGLAAMEAHNKAKAAVLYDYLDASAFYSNPVATRPTAR